MKVSSGMVSGALLLALVAADATAADAPTPDRDKLRPRALPVKVETSRARQRLEYGAPAVRLHYDEAYVDPEIPRSSAKAPTREALPSRESGRPRPHPDESVLWQLYHQGENARVLEQIEKWSRKFPGWRPPRELVALVERARWEAAFQRARDEGAGELLIALARRRPAAFGCDHVDRWWALAEAYLDQGERGQGVEIYSRIIGECSSEREKVATLERARERVPETALESLFEEAGRSLIEGEAERTFRAMLSGWLRERLGRALQTGEDPMLIARLEGEVGGTLRREQDAGLARGLGWYHLRDHRPAQAAAWFGPALAWQPTPEAAEGMIESLLERGFDERAIELGMEWSSRSERIAARTASTLRGAAAKAYEQGRYDEALVHLARAGALGGLDENGRRLQAWALLAAGRRWESARLFEALYRQSPSPALADGLIGSVPGGAANRRVEALAREVGGPVYGRWLEHRSAMYRGRGLPLAAHALSPRTQSDLEGLTEPQWAGGIALRSKSGRTGEDRLQITTLPAFEASLVASGTHRFVIEAGQVLLDAGSGPTFSGPRGAIRYRHEGWLTSLASLGTTPAGGEIGPRISGTLGVERQLEEGLWEGEVYSEPVRDSLLSYVGARPDGQARSFGAVDRRGVRAGYRRPLGEGWQLGARADLARLSGSGVATNDRWEAGVGAGYELGLPGMAYASVGPYLSYTAYQRNLSHFTPGHGGYFSPQSWLSGGAAMDLRTKESERFLARAHVEVGYQRHVEEAAPLFPLAPDGRLYGGAEDSGWSYSIEAFGAWHLRRGWRLGAGVTLRQTAAYDDLGVVLTLGRGQLRRRALLEQDLPRDSLHSVY